MMAGCQRERQKGRLCDVGQIPQPPQEDFLEEAGWMKTDERVEMAEDVERNGKSISQVSLNWRLLEAGR